MLGKDTADVTRLAASIEFVGADTKAGAIDGDILFNTWFSNNKAEVMRITHDKTVGIGIPSPGGLFHINNSGAVISIVESTDNAASFQLKADSNNEGEIRDAQIFFNEGGTTSWVMGMDTSDARKFKISPSTGLPTSTAVTIDTTGQVGINATTPARQLHVFETSVDMPLRVESGDAKVGMEFKDGTATSNIGQTAGDFFIDSNNDGTFEMVVENGGNVGINTTTPASKLQVNGNFTVIQQTDDNGIKIFGSGGASAAYGHFFVDDSGVPLVRIGSGSNHRFYLDGGGDTNVITHAGTTIGVWAGSGMGMQDNMFFAVGSAQDSSILYNTTDTIWNVQRVGEGNLYIPNGTVEIGEGVEIGTNLTVKESANITKDLVVWNRIFVGGDPSQTSILTNPGDMGIAGNFIAGKGFISAIPRNSSLAFLIANAGDDLPGKARFFFNFAGELNTTTGLFCDSTGTPFLTTDASNFLGVLFSNEFGTDQLTFFVDTVHNSTCSTLNIASLGSRDVPDLTGVSYAIAPPGIFNIFDGGVVNMNIGEHPDARFTVNVFNGSGDDGIFFNDVAGVNNHEAFVIHQDIKTFSGTLPFHTSLFSTTGADSIISTVMSIDVDVTGINNSMIDMFDALIIGTPGPSTSVDFLNVDSRIGKIIKAGSADAIDSAFYNDINITANVTDAANDVTVFEVVDDVIYVGNNGNFTAMSVELSIESSHNQNFLFFYCNNTAGYSSLGAEIDTTVGFQDSGTITFVSPSDRGKCNSELDGTTFSSGENYTYIAIQRTRAFVLTDPVIDRIDISGSTQSFILQKDMIKLQKVSAPPETCSVAFEGGIYYDDDINIHCACTGINWVQMDDYTTVCS